MSKVLEEKLPLKNLLDLPDELLKKIFFDKILSSLDNVKSLLDTCTKTNKLLSLLFLKIIKYIKLFNYIKNYYTNLTISNTHCEYDLGINLNLDNIFNVNDYCSIEQFEILNFNKKKNNLIFCPVENSNDFSIIIDNLGKEEIVFSRKKKIQINQEVIKINIYDLNFIIYKCGKILIYKVKSLESLKYVYFVLKELSNKFINNHTKIINLDNELYLINSQITLDYPLDNQKLYELLLQKEDNHSIRYTPEYSSGIYIKYFIKNRKKGISVTIFGKSICHTNRPNGIMLLSGAKSIEDINEIYNYINNIIQDNLTELILDKNDIKVVKEMKTINGEMWFKTVPSLKS